MNIIAGVLAVLLIGNTTGFSTNPTDNSLSKVQDIYKSETQQNIYKQIFISSILSQVEDIITESYKNNKEVRVDFTSIDILNIEKPLGEQSISVFDITLKITPFVGPHNTIGEDILIIRIDPTTKGFKLLEYEHIKDFI